MRSARWAKVAWSAALFVLALSAAADAAVVHVYRDRYEYEGKVYRTVDELRAEVSGKPIGFEVRERGVDSKVSELQVLMRENARSLNGVRVRVPSGGNQ